MAPSGTRAGQRHGERRGQQSRSNDFGPTDHGSASFSIARDFQPRQNALDLLFHTYA